MYISHKTRSFSIYTSKTNILHLSVEEVAILINILDGLLGNAVTLLLPGKCRIGEDARGRVLGLAATMAGFLVVRAFGQGNVNGRRLVHEGLTSRLALGGLGKLLVGCAEIGELILILCRDDLGALD